MIFLISRLRNRKHFPRFRSTVIETQVEVWENEKFQCRERQLSKGRAFPSLQSRPDTLYGLRPRPRPKFEIIWERSKFEIIYFEFGSGTQTRYTGTAGENHNVFHSATPPPPPPPQRWYFIAIFCPMRYDIFHQL